MITLDEAIERVKPFVEERPDFRYEPIDVFDEYGEVYDAECRYFAADGSPSCIVGHAFVDKLRAQTDWIEGMEVAGLKELLGLDQDATNFLSELQRLQDRKVAWGEAFEIARERAVKRTLT